MQKKKQAKGKVEIKRPIKRLIDEMDNLTREITRHRSEFFQATGNVKLRAFDKLLKTELDAARLSGYLKQWHYVHDLYDRGELKSIGRFKIVWPNPKTKTPIEFPIPKYILIKLKEIHLRAITEQNLILTDYEMAFPESNLQKVISKYRNSVHNQIRAFRARDQKVSRITRSPTSSTQKLLQSFRDTRTSNKLFMMPLITPDTSTLAVMAVEAWPYKCMYGNFCGPLCGYPSDKPIDPCVDAACRAHDECYETKGYFSPECDLAFIRAMWDCNPGDNIAAQTARVIITAIFLPIYIVESVAHALFDWFFGDDAGTTLHPADDYGPQEYWIHLRNWDKPHYEGDMDCLVLSGVRQNECYWIGDYRDVDEMRSAKLYDNNGNILPEGMKVTLYWGGKKCPTWKPHGVITVPAGKEEIRIPNIDYSSENYQVFNNFHQTDGRHRVLGGHVRGVNWSCPI